MAELNELTLNGNNYTFEDDVARGLATTEASRAQAAEQTIDGKIGQNTQAIANEKSRAEGAEGALQQLIQQVNTSLINYYLKSETYSKTEVNAIIGDVKQFRYQVAATLPTASADTMGIIYLIPSAAPKTQNIKEEYLTILDGSTYKWEHIGDTNIDLSGYSTTEQMNAAIASALASYYTKSEVDEALGGKQNTIDDLTDIRSGASAGSTAVQPSTLNNAVKNVVAESGVYDVSANNDNTKFESLNALLSSANLNTLIPTDIRKGGMSIKFVLSSDNNSIHKYVQFRYMSSSIAVADFTNVANWQGVDDTPTSNSNNLITSDGVKNALTIHLTYILYQRGDPTAEGQYYIHHGELRYCTRFATTSNYGYTVIPFNPDILYEYKGFYFKWNGTSLVMLETSVSEHLRTVAEVDGVKDANALDISDLVSSTYTKLNTDGTISTGINYNQVATLYHIPVNRGMRIRCRVYGTKVIGYKSINDASPVVLFNAGSSNPSTITTYDIRIPEEITYIRVGVDSGGGSRIYLIEDDLYLQETIDVDIAHPLDSGYYTFSTAISTLALSYAMKGRKIKFRIDENHWEEYTYMLDSVASADWTNILNWRKTNGEEYSNKGYIASDNKSIVIDNRGYNTQLAQPLIDIVNKEYQPDTDFYLERVMKFVKNNDDIYYWLSLKKIFYIRTLRGGFQLYYRGTAVNNSFGASFVFDNLYHHLMIVKYHEDVTEDEETVRKHYLAMYIDGVKFGNSINVSSYTGLDNEAKTTFINVGKNLGMLLYRVGLPSLVEGDIEGLVARHYNDGNPIAYVCKEEDTIAEILGYNMHSSYFTNSANGLSLEVSDVDIVTESPYDNPLTDEGVPNFSPKYVNQEYQDTLTNNRYIAKGTTLPGDWHQEATMSDVNALKTQTKTVNGQSIWGSGDIEGGGSGSGGGNVISVLNYGAVGDGATDDTAAIMAATEAARTGGKALYFPNGTYLTRKSIVLTSGMKVTGEPNAILQSASATLEGGGKCIFTTLTTNAAAGATQITVNNAAGFVVGQEIVIWKSGSYTETMADITAISGNTITIDTSRFTANGTNGGIKNAVSSGGYVLTDFALIKTIQTKAAENIVVENITLKAMSDITEPHIYTSSPISQTRQENNVPQKNFRVYNVTVLDSANDGISIQGSGESEIIGCRVYNQKHKGIHWGTSHDMARIMNNFVYGCGSAQYEDASDYQGSGAMFFCSNNHRIIITGNHIENCYKGIFGFNYQSNGECDSNTIIANNTFKNCALYGVILRDGIHAVLEANNFLGFGGTSIPIYVDNPDGQHLRNAVIANNTIGEWNAATQSEGAYMPAIKIEGADGIVINGNVISVKKLASSSPTVDASRCNIVVVGSNNVIITSNITEGNIDTADSGNTGIVSANNITGS